MITLCDTKDNHKKKGATTATTTLLVKIECISPGNRLNLMI
jgi:hypothetical protein